MMLNRRDLNQSWIRVLKEDRLRMMLNSRDLNPPLKISSAIPMFENDVK